MSATQQPAIVPDRGRRRRVGRTPMHRHVLTNDTVATNRKSHITRILLSGEHLVLLVLRLSAQTGERMHHGAAANLSLAVDHHVALQPHVRFQHHI